MNIYTYVVDHGEELPGISVSTVVNGGELKAVMFDDGLAKLDFLEEFIHHLREETSCDQTKRAIDDLFIEWVSD